MKVHTQDDFIVALMALCFQNNVCEEPQTAFFKTVSGMRTDEEKLRLVARAEQLVDDGDPLPTSPTNASSFKLPKIRTQQPSSEGPRAWPGPQGA